MSLFANRFSKNALVRSEFHTAIGIATPFELSLPRFERLLLSVSTHALLKSVASSTTVLPDNTHVCLLLNELTPPHSLPRIYFAHNQDYIPTSSLDPDLRGMHGRTQQHFSSSVKISSNLYASVSIY
jgi:hypothetical protein